MFEITIIIAVVLGLTEFIKRLSFLPVKYLPAASVVFGLLAGIFYVDVQTIEEKIMFGLMIGFDCSRLV
ncbi:hypothetical protein ACTHO0_25915 [Cytobacillus praedii]|uniref:hypothetical protein n=1 Tax=Cytobacillus praedii TaxID=1742358 RepID=UPI003F7CE230